MSKDVWKVNLGVFLAMLSLFVMAYAFGHALTPFIIAMLFAYILNPAVNALVKRRVPRTAAVGIFMLAFFLLVACGIAFAAYILNREVHQLIANIPGYVETFETRYLPEISRRFGMAENIDINEVVSRLKDRLVEISPESYRSAGVYALKLVSGTVGFFLAVLNLLLIPVIMAYLMLDFEKMKSAILESFPKPHRKYIAGRLVEVEEVLKLFVKGQLMVAVSMGVMYSLGLAFIGVDMPVLVGMSAGLLNLVPYLGGAVGIVTAVTLAALRYHDMLHPALVVLLFALVQTVEGYVLTPRIVGNRLGLHPVVVILALVVMGQIMGFVGVLLALPVAAVLKVFIVSFMRDYRSSEAFNGKTGKAA